jgi:hypothetical protein
MIGRFLGDLVTRLVTARLFPSRRAPVASPRGGSRPRSVIVSPDEMSARARDYEAWAMSRGLLPVREESVGADGARFRGTRCGRGIELTTGIGPFGPPRSPELLVRTDALAPSEPLVLSQENMEHAAAAASWARELTMVLDVDGVRDIGVTRRFVRVRFDAFVRPKTLGHGWDALESALAAITNTADPESPYR